MSDTTQTVTEQSVEARNKAIVTEFYRIKNERDYDALDAIMHPDFQAKFARHFGDDEPFNPAYLKEKWWAYVGAFPDLFYDVEALVAEDEWVVARLHYRGTHEGVLSGFEPTHNKINVNQHLSIRIVDGKIIEMHSTADFLTGLWKPLGITPPMNEA